MLVHGEAQRFSLRGAYTAYHCDDGRGELLILREAGFCSDTSACCEEIRPLSLLSERRGRRERLSKAGRGRQGWGR